MARSHGTRLNLFGAASILLALAAVVASRIPIMGYGSLPIALLAVGVGVLGFLIGLVSRVWGTGTPALGVILSLGAIGWVYYQDGTVPAWWARMHPAPSTPARLVTPPPAVPTNPTSPATQGDPNIFTNPEALPDAATPSAGPAHLHTPARSPDPEIPASPAPPVISAPPTLSVADARAKLDAATASVERSLASDPAYAAAKSAVDDADAKRKSALSANGAGSAEIQAVSSDWLAAKAKLKKVVDAAAAKDPAVESAQRDLRDAEVNARSGKSPAH